MKYVGFVVAACAGLSVLALVGCGGTGSEATPAPSGPHTSATTAAHAGKAKSAAADRAMNRCYARKPASGDIYVRMKSPGTSTVAQELGGQWTWNHVTSTCQTSVQWIIASAPTGIGNCTWVGYKADNRRYRVNATPAPPLKHVAAEAGGSC